jgi:hypothetical protein
VTIQDKVEYDGAQRPTIAQELSVKVFPYTSIASKLLILALSLVKSTFSRIVWTKHMIEGRAP